MPIPNIAVRLTPDESWCDSDQSSIDLLQRRLVDLLLLLKAEPGEYHFHVSPYGKRINRNCAIIVDVVERGYISFRTRARDIDAWGYHLRFVRSPSAPRGLYYLGLRLREHAQLLKIQRRSDPNLLAIDQAKLREKQQRGADSLRSQLTTVDDSMRALRQRRRALKLRLAAVEAQLEAGKHASARS